MTEQGCAFSVTIEPEPLQGIRMIERTETSSPSPSLAAAPPRAGGVELHARVLLAEDGADNQRLIRFLLTKAGADVTTVDHGQLAVQTALAEREAGRPFDVILMDMQMPVMDGYAATRALRQQGYRGPIIALTADTMAGDRQKCLAAGSDDYLSKPIDRQRLLGMVAEWAARAPSRSSAGRGRVPPSPPEECLSSACADDPVIAGILGEFVGCLDARVQALRQALDGGQFEELRRLAHQLRGAAGSYGYPSLTEAAQELEDHARTGRRDAAVASLARVSRLCQAAVRGWSHRQDRMAAETDMIPQPSPEMPPRTAPLLAKMP